MAKRTTIELDEDLVKRAQRVTGDTLRSTVEQALRLLLQEAEAEAEERGRRLAEHLTLSLKRIDVDVLLSDVAWR